jgi:hypothetical protein
MAGAYHQPELHAAFTVEPPHGLGQKDGSAPRGFEATNFAPFLKLSIRASAAAPWLQTEIKEKSK